MTRHETVVRDAAEKWRNPLRQASGESRVFGLDVLRASAILFVVYGHGYNLVSDKISESAYSVIVFDGVTLFFVLSGYLIGRILIRSLTTEGLCLSDLTTFWIRRWFRTLPNYFFVLSLLVLASWPVPLPVIASYATFTQNIAWPHPKFFAEAWSLAVEEWFYLVVPIPLFVGLRFSRADQRWMIICWAVAVDSWRHGVQSVPGAISLLRYDRAMGR